MKLYRWTNFLAVAGGLALASAAYAQSEQWLQYHTTREGRSYHWITLTTNAPAGVALPKLGDKPYFAHWETPMDPKGRWIVFNRTRKSGLWDQVYVDSTGNGRLDDKSPIKAASLDQISATFDSLRFVFKGEDGPVTYHLVLRFMKYGDQDIRLLAESGGYYAGTINVGGKKRHVELIDGNVNGVFNDSAAKSDECDRISIENDKVGERYLGKFLEVDGQLYRLEVARDGAFVKLQKADHVEMGVVRIGEGVSEFEAVGENGHFQRQPVKGEFSLPVGKYRLHSWAINRKDARGESWQMTGSSFGDAGNFVVAADKPAVLTVGEPVRMAMVASESKSEVGFSLRFQGRYNETVDIMKGTQRPRAPQLTLTSLDGAYRYTNSFEFG